MDDKPNVNNLNGVPNFGHGFPEEEEVEVEEEATPKKKKAGVDK